ncbi:Variant SH3 domain [Plasmopara halstedii]|uniref:Variant SH3 domain n=1 Tax=Plasmopara halstedii TaxID=4781 RepID=A0A0P1AU32_PLAHL|nr:Variant SH3 domain [Plasmopara halstedii]CEG44770.1 Variant SH3 domain [Plasmopara halstedii]|eukprot:XP_024581139.1 Variant SH3 domain [Plasmopara halstedii]
MLPALTTKPKQAVRQLHGLSNDSIDSYVNMPLSGGSSTESRMGVTYVDNTESGRGTVRASALASDRLSMNLKSANGEDTITMARVLRDRKAFGDEELSLRTGEIVKVLSTKRTGYLKCEAEGNSGYIPSSYLEFLEVDNGLSGSSGTNEEAQRAVEAQRKRHQHKEKRRKEKQEAKDAEIALATARSTNKEASNDDNEFYETPRKRNKKERKTREYEASDNSHRDKAEMGHLSTRSRGAPTDTERIHGRSKHSKKKRHHDIDSSESSDYDGKRCGRHGRCRCHHRFEASDSESESTSDHKRSSRRSKTRRDKGDAVVEPVEEALSSRKAEKKKLAAALQQAEKGVGQLEIEAKDKAKETVLTSKNEVDRDKGKEMKLEQSEKSAATATASHHKNDEGSRISGSISSSKQDKSGFGRQIGEKMRSLLGGGNKKSHNSSKSSGILNACPGTVQGEEGWYEHGENERYYFVLIDRKWSLLYGPMTEDEFEDYSNRVTTQKRSIELPPTFLHKSGYFLNCELRVQKN